MSVTVTLPTVSVTTTLNPSSASTTIDTSPLVTVAQTASTTAITSMQGIQGVGGLSAYQQAQANGFIGSQAEWLASLKGTDGSANLPATFDAGFF